MTERHPTEQNEAFVIRHITHNDIQSLTRNFAPYNKKQEMYERLWREHELGKRVTLVAITGQEAVGYANLLWQSSYEPFRENDIPEIHNMHVIDEHQQQGIGTALIKEAERIATDHNKKTIGIGVDIKPKKNTIAQRLYEKLGYKPDERGPSPAGDILFLTKALPKSVQTAPTDPKQ
jgi:GNAT superfamily N-acetyltransferase